jgi:hypothetical protein
MSELKLRPPKEKEGTHPLKASSQQLTVDSWREERAGEEWTTLYKRRKAQAARHPPVELVARTWGLIEV